MKSARELFNEALSYLGVVGSGQDASAEDFETMKGLFSPLMAELNTRADYYLSPSAVVEETQINDDAFLVLTELLANEAAPRFGKQKADFATREMMLARLRRLTATGPVYNTHHGCYF